MIGQGPMLKLLACLFIFSAAGAQTNGGSAPSAPNQDPMGRDSPYGSVLQFLQASRAHDYGRAIRSLDVRQMSPEQRAQEAPQLASQLEDILDRGAFDITSLSRDPLGDVSDGLPINREVLISCKVNGQNQTLELERVTFKSGLRVWLVAADELALIPQMHQFVSESWFERKLPQPLVKIELLETPVWRWIALTLMAAALWYIAGLLAHLLVRLSRSLFEAQAFRRPVQAFLAAVAFRAAMSLATPAALPRLYLQRVLELASFLSVAWVGSAVVDLVTERWRSRLDQRAQAMSFSVLPLGRQVLKLSLFLLAMLTVLSQWGYNTSTILAGLGVGGLAVALAAQKTIENLFGGVSVIGDRPVLVGDFCRFGSHVGTVMHIGLRSTRIRTLDRTIISVPNGQFSLMELENFSARDKIWFHQTLSLRRDSSSEQLLRVLGSLSEILRAHPKVEVGEIPVRFTTVGNYSLDVEIFAYVLTADFDAFLGIQQELLLKILQLIEASGLRLAVPLMENLVSAGDARSDDRLKNNET